MPNPSRTYPVEFKITLTEREIALIEKHNGRGAARTRIDSIGDFVARATVLAIEALLKAEKQS